MKLFNKELLVDDMQKKIIHEQKYTVRIFATRLIDSQVDITSPNSLHPHHFHLLHKKRGKRATAHLFVVF